MIDTLVKMIEEVGSTPERFFALTALSYSQYQDVFMSANPVPRPVALDLKRALNVARGRRGMPEVKLADLQLDIEEVPVVDVYILPGFTFVEEGERDDPLPDDDEMSGWRRE